MTVKIKPDITNFYMDAFNVGKDIFMPNFVYFQFSGSGDKLLKVAGSQVENAQKWLLFKWLNADSDCMVHGARLLIDKNPLGDRELKFRTFSRHFRFYSLQHATWSKFEFTLHVKGCSKDW